MIFSVVDWLTGVVTSITHAQTVQGTRMPFLKTTTNNKTEKIQGKPTVDMLMSASYPSLPAGVKGTTT